MKLGRKARAFNPKVPHLSALLQRPGVVLPPVPASVDWTTGMPDDLGMMLNDRLGDCTCAAMYHARQVWTYNVNKTAMDSEPDANVELVYAQACGYEPGNPATDNGGVEQDVLSYWMKQGIPILPSVGSAGTASDKLAAFVEIDPRNVDDVKRGILECGVDYIGIQVPTYLMSTVGGNPGALWDVAKPGDDVTIDGGHAIVLPGYNEIGPKVISWGKVYQMTWAFFKQYTDEVYAPVDRAWVNSQGVTPFGMTLEQLEEQVTALKAA